MQPLTRILTQILTSARRALKAPLGKPKRKTAWNIGIAEGDFQDFFLSSSPRTIHWLPPRADGFRADPFGVVRNGRRFVFYEFMPFIPRAGETKRKGVINMLELSEDLRILQEKTVLETDAHLSFPFVFAFDGAVNLLPESGKSGKLTLYRFESFPDRLAVAAVLLDLPAIDPVVFRHQERWWLFYGDRRVGSAKKLFIAYADSPLGPWRPHAGNPVKKGLAASRNAGAVFHRDGKLYRYTQNCSVRYGGSVVLCEITVLTPQAFHEEAIKEIFPDTPEFREYTDGFHHISPFGSRTLIDGRRLRADADHV